MPKKFSIADKRQWLELYESDKSEKWIAREKAGCDVRTVKRGIEEARRERDGRAIRAELLKDAVRRHQDDLLAIIDDTLAAIAELPLNVQLPKEEELRETPIPMTGARIDYREGKGWTVTLAVDGKPQSELLREHLKRQAIWRLIDKWKRVLLADLEARIALRHKAAQLLSKKATSNDKAFVHPAAVDFLYQTALNHALGIADGVNPEDRVVAKRSGDVEGHPGQILAYAHEGAQELRVSILAALEKLRGSMEAKKAAEAYGATQEPTAKARKALQETSLFHMLPGQCRVCRRFGM